jgi:hypothetical protein
MKIRVFLWIAALVCVFSLAAPAADIDGKWIAQMPSRGGETREVTFTFKADGQNLTGTMSTQRGEREISDGKIVGDDVSFTMSFGENKMLYKGKLSGNEIKFTVEREGRPAREFTAKRAAS